ncbi:MAG: hypothetical protein PHW03_05380 [Eubacteriales bacterium]|nr:hypothetical protein [Eubacteriales bacterium]
MSLARDLARHDRDMEEADREQSFREDIKDTMDEINRFLTIGTPESFIKARSQAEYLKELINERCV